MRGQEWLAERIWDIMNLKKYSLRKLFPLAKMNSAMELSRYLDGTSYITPSVLTKIANGLGVTVERIQQTDVPEGLFDELDKMMQLGEDVEKAESIARKLLILAVGAKEKIHSHRILGWSLYYQGRFEEAKEEWEKSYELAVKKPPRKNEKHTDEQMLFKTTIDLSNYYIHMKDYLAAIKLLDSSQVIFVGDFMKLGMIHQNRGLCLAKLGDIKAAKQHYLISYECYVQVENQEVRLARIEGNLADIEFHEGNISKAIALLEKAKINATNDSLVSRGIIDKDLARALICEERTEEALELIEKQLKNRYLLKRPELVGKLLLMKSDITKNPVYAEEIFTLGDISRELRCNAADLLTEFYMNVGDSGKAKRYYGIMKETIISGVVDYKTGDWF